VWSALLHDQQCGEQPKGPDLRVRGNLPAEARASDRRHRGAEAPLELASELMGAGHGNVAELADGLAAAAHTGGEALVATRLDAILADLHHQGADLAAESVAVCH
jgi:hypothetical protein